MSIPFGQYLPLVIGICFIIMGLLYLVMPATSLIKLDKRIEAWIQADPDSTSRRAAVLATYKVFGIIISAGGMLYTLITLSKHAL
jgi:hypothetical protein